MVRYVLHRIVLVVPTLFGILTAVFILLHAIPGDPAVALAGDTATVAQMAEIRREYGLDRPITTQYAEFIRSAMTFDFGRSLQTHQPIWRELHEYFGATLELSITSLIIALFGGIPLGVIAASRRGTLVDYSVTVFSVVSSGIPVYWSGIVLIYFLSFRLRLFPIAGVIDNRIALHHITYGYVIDSILTGNRNALLSSLHYLAMPAIVLATFPMAVIARTMRSSVLDVLGQDYLRTARAKGLTNRSVIAQHAVKNALIPVVTVIGLQFSSLLSGAFLTETVFARPGVGRYIVTAIGARDYPVVLATVWVVTVLNALVNLLADVCYAFLDPRIRY